MSQVNSHIQMPKSIMKNFHNENKELFYYDCQEERIGKGHAKTFYTENGYFSAYVEKYLDKRVEGRLGALVKFIKESSFEKGEVPPNQYEEIAFIYLYSLMFRAPEYINEINSNSKLFQFISLIDQHDIAVHDSIEKAKEKRLLREYEVAFLVNKSEEELVLPAGGIVQYGTKLVCPVSPLRAIVFNKVFSDEREKQNKSVITLFEIASKKKIQEINFEAVRQEIFRNKKYVIASSREILERSLGDEIRDR